MPFEGALIFVFVTSAYLLCYKREMAGSQKAKSDIDVVESRRQGHPTTIFGKISVRKTI